MQTIAHTIQKYLTLYADNSSHYMQTIAHTIQK